MATKIRKLRESDLRTLRDCARAYNGNLLGHHSGNVRDAGTRLERLGLVTHMHAGSPFLIITAKGREALASGTTTEECA
jgi:hypothetical protein